MSSAAPAPHLLFFSDAQSVHTQRWVGAMLQRGWRCTVVSRLHAPIEGARVIVLGTPATNRGWLGAAPTARMIARSVRPDLVHGHYITSYGFLAASCGVKPLVLTGWGSDILVSPHQSRLVRVLTGWTLRRAALVTADSRDMLDEIAGYRPRARLEQVYWGADTAKFRPQPGRTRGPNDPFRIVSLRAWEGNYNIDTLIAATALLRKRAPALPLELHLLGGGPLERTLRAQVDTLGLQDVVRFHGKVDEDRMAELVNAASVSVSIPHSDATSVSLLESMAAGLPVVVSRLPANRQWVDQDKGGFLLPARDTARLSQALWQLASEPLKARRMGLYNRDRVEPHAARRVQMDRMDALYRELLRLPAPGAPAGSPPDILL